MIYRFTSFLKVLFIVSSLIFVTACNRKSIPATSAVAAPVVETGVSAPLAQYRKQVVSDIVYQLQFDIPLQKEQPIPASETISFRWKKNRDSLQIDFKEQKKHLQKIKVNGKETDISFQKEHILIAPSLLNDDANEISIQFTAGNLSLNRNEDYLFTLLVPDRARTVFPCFDQPDLKAVFHLSLVLPKDWKAVANAPLQDSVVQGERKTYHYRSSDTIPTYLFSFAAGKFEKVTKELDGSVMNFYHRETDTAKIRLSTDSIFTIQADALTFMKEYTQIPFPFKKFDFAAIPAFQYGGMEHVGAILYNASSLFLDEGATQDQKIARANVLAHETAHMWFGDLVTMRWFNDVWMKEVFANFMADKISQVTSADANFDLKFLIAHYPAAYSVDRTAGANPIRQTLENLQDAGTLYGSIIYHKAPIVMRQLERLMGKDAFRNGLRAYLKKYAYSNASWPDLIQVMSAYTTVDLQAWNQVWINEPGRPQFDYSLIISDNKITDFVITQKGEDSSKRLWPQVFEIALIYPDHTETLRVNMNRQRIILKEAIGKSAPACVLFNSSGEGYGLFPSDTALLSNIWNLPNPVMRAAAYINVYENMLSNRQTTPQQLIESYRHHLLSEAEELNVQLLTSQLSDVFWRLILPEQRPHLAALLEQDLKNAINNATTPNIRKIFFKTYQSIALSREAQDLLYYVWKRQEPPAGVKLTEDDYTALALALAVRDYPAPDILEQQMQRIQNPDRKKRMAFLMPALSPDVQMRNDFFASLEQKNNREKEAWVTSALAYLHHPLRAATSQKYLKKSLDLLEEIQLTGDIFFPGSWLQATLGAYQTPEAAAIVRTFLQQHPDYNPKLKAKILQAADPLFRAEQLLYGAKQPSLRF